MLLCHDCEISSSVVFIIIIIIIIITIKRRGCGGWGGFCDVGMRFIGVQSSSRCLSLQLSYVGLRLIVCPSSMSNADER